MDESPQSQQSSTQPQFNATTVVQPSPQRRFPVLITIILVVLVGALAAGGAWFYMQQQNEISQLKSQVTDLTKQVAAIPNYEYTSAKGVKMFVYAPKNGATVTSPVQIVGLVPGNWSQETNFPVELKNAQGEVIVQTVAMVHGDWMTGDLQPFAATIVFPAGQTGAGNIVLQYANPSGLPDKADSVSIPVQF